MSEKLWYVTMSKIWEMQCDFMPHRVCSGSSKTIFEKYECEKVVYYIFVDSEKAYDKTKKLEFWTICMSMKYKPSW